MTGVWEKFMTRFSNDKKLRRIIIAVTLAAILLLALSELIDFSGAEKTSAEKEYTEVLENRISQLIGQMSGVGRVEVMVTLEDGANCNAASSEDAGSKAIAGVLILCEGGGSRVTSAKITEAVAVALGIGSNRICVIEMSSD